MTVQAYLDRMCESLTRDVLAGADAAANRLQAAFRAEKAAILAARSTARAPRAAAPTSAASAIQAAPAAATADTKSSTTALDAAAVIPAALDVRLEALSGPHAGTVFVLQPRGRSSVPKIGRSTGKAFAKQGVSLPGDLEVSTTHAKIEERAGSIFVTDLDSTNGTTLNGEDLEPRRPYELLSGAELRVGATRLQVLLIAATSTD